MEDTKIDKLIIKKCQERVYDFERGNIIRKLFLTLSGKKPNEIEYEICLSNPMSREMLQIFPVRKIKKRRIKPI